MPDTSINLTVIDSCVVLLFVLNGNQARLKRIKVLPRICHVYLFRTIDKEVQLRPKERSIFISSKWKRVEISR